MRKRRSLTGGRPLTRRPPVPDAGATLVEMIAVLAVAAAVFCVATPMTATVIDAGRARQAAGFLAARFRLARQQAAARSDAVALVFDLSGGRSSFQVCSDGNGNGVRRSEIASGRDICGEGPYDLERMFPGVRFAVDSAIPGPDGEAGSADAVRFGRGDLASFSPSGTGSSGSIYLRSPNGTQYVVRVAGATARTRLLRYDAVARAWRDQ